MRFNFPKLLPADIILCNVYLYSFPEVVRDNVVSSEVTITSSCIDVRKKI